MKAPVCRLCKTEHWGNEHRWGAKDAEPEAEAPRVTKRVTQHVTKPRDSAPRVTKPRDSFAKLLDSGIVRVGPLTVPTGAPCPTCGHIQRPVKTPAERQRERRDRKKVKP